MVTRFVFYKVLCNNIHMKSSVIICWKPAEIPFQNVYFATLSQVKTNCHSDPDLNFDPSLA